MAPEVVDSKNRVEYDGQKSDVWSCGVVLYVMLVGMYPFAGGMRGVPQEQHNDYVLRRIRGIDYTVPDYVSMDARNLIEKCLTTSSNRASISDIMQHAWFLKNFPNEARTMNATIIAEQAAGQRSGNDVQAAEEAPWSINWHPEYRKRRDIMDPEWYEPMIDEELKRDDNDVEGLAMHFRMQKIRSEQASIQENASR